MRISFSKKFIFVHLAKTAGLSMKKAIEPYCYLPHKSVFNKGIAKYFRYYFIPKDCNLIDLISLMEYAHRSALEIKHRLNEPSLLRFYQEQYYTKNPDYYSYANIFDDFYKFAFVRNPWDREVSLFHYLKQSGRKKTHYIHSCENFEAFIKYRYELNQKYPHLLPIQQYDQLCDENGAICVNFVGKFENIAEDFSFICNQINIENNLPHRNSSKRLKDYNKYYSSETKSMVETIYKKDIEHFGYQFD